MFIDLEYLRKTAKEMAARKELPLMFRCDGKSFTKTILTMMILEILFSNNKGEPDADIQS